MKDGVGLKFGPTPSHVPSNDRRRSGRVQTSGGVGEALEGAAEDVVGSGRADLIRPRGNHYVLSEGAPGPSITTRRGLLSFSIAPSFPAYRALSAAPRPSPGGARGRAGQRPTDWLSRSVPWPAPIRATAPPWLGALLDP